MALPPGPLPHSTDAESALFDLVDAYDRAYEAAAAAQGLSAAQACVLGRLDRPRAMGELAAELGCDASNVTQIVGRLEARGLVERRPAAHDRRGREVVPTRAGRTALSRFERAFAFGREAVGRLDDEERERLVALLRKAVGTPG